MISVIVLFDRGECEPCFSSILGQTGVEFEIIAVTGEGAAVPPSDRVRPLIIPERNPALRRNRAAEEAKGEYLAFIDDDATAPPDWLKTGLDYLATHPDVAGVGGPNLAPEDRPLREDLTEIVLTAPFIGAGSRAYRGGGEALPAKPGEIHLVNFMVSKSWFEKAGGFSEALGYGAEDTEFVYRAGRLGARFMFLPQMKVRHRRRPFGPAYFRQRFHLRKQTGWLFVSVPGVYLGSKSFLAALTVPPLALALLIVGWVMAGWIFPLVCLGGYIILTMTLVSGRYRRLEILGMAPLVFFAHLAVNLAGLWMGIMSAVFSEKHKPRF